MKCKSGERKVGSRCVNLKAEKSGLRGWAEEYQVARANSNFKLAKQVRDNITNRMKKLKLSEAEQKKIWGVDWESLVGGDMYATRVISDRIAHGIKPEEALHIYTNSVEGDISQLPDKLTAYAKNKGWMEGYD
jgi:hypothetical protein